MMSAPPSPPPGTPTMSAYRPSMQDEEGEGGDEFGAGQAGAIPKLFYAAHKALDDIAAAAPTVASDIDKVKSTLMDVLGKVVSSGAAERAPISPMGEGMPSFGV